MDWSDSHFETRAIHAGQDPEEKTGAVIVPIYQTSTFAQPSPGEHLGHEYTRTSNPTRDALQEALAACESGNYGLAFASGLAATNAVIATLSAGDEVIAMDDNGHLPRRVIDAAGRGDTLNEACRSQGIGVRHLPQHPCVSGSVDRTRRLHHLVRKTTGRRNSRQP